MAGRPRGTLILDAAERRLLERWSRQPTTTQALAQRARIILMCADGSPNTQVAEHLGVSRDTVGKWRSRFLADRLAGLRDEARPGPPRRITKEQIADVVARALERPGPGAGWTTRSVAAATGLSQSTVSRIWRASGVEPRLAQIRRLVTEPRFTGRVRDLAGLYLHPPESSLVLCADVEPQMTGPVPATARAPGAPARAAPGDHQDRRQRQREFLRFLEKVDAAVPAQFDLHLISGSPASHRAAAVRDWLARRPRYHVHHVPADVTWASLVEWWFALAADRAAGRPGPVAWINTTAGSR